MKRAFTYGILIAVGIAIGLWLNQGSSFSIAGLLPFAVLLLCPLMMIGMMGGHGHGGHDQTYTPPQPKQPGEHDGH